MTAQQIRQTFLDFFKSKEHHIVTSASIVVKNDPTLMFTNAGMNQFKDIFLGNKNAEYPMVADTQKCLRVSGKHNDLEEVGIDTYHHTMFEMLGNWSFGNYFKKEAIQWAWELLTEIYKIPKDRLYVTVFEGSTEDNLPLDEEAFSCWEKIIDKEKILKGNKKDNFWEMGDTGPCGPCSEIHVDIRSDEERKKTDGKKLVNTGHSQVIEIWNLVFIQFNRLSDGHLQQLQQKHVDTGMGFERLCMVLQAKQSTYETDVFTPLIKEIEKLSEKKYGSDEKINIAIRVLCDHIRAVSFCIVDGQLPSNTGSGYVIRRILRRAVRYAYSYLEMGKPILNELVFVLAEQMKNVFPELFAQKDFVKQVIWQEEHSFLGTLMSGIKKFEDYVLRQYLLGVGPKVLKQKFLSDLGEKYYQLLLQSHKNFMLSVEEKDGVLITNYHFNPEYFNTFSGEEITVPKDHPILIGEKGKFGYENEVNGSFAFELYDTYGFPIDLTQLLAKEIRWTVDINRFETAMEKQKSRSRKATTVESSDWEVANTVLNNQVEFVGYDKLEEKAEVFKFRKIKAKEKELYQVVLNKTPFYAESGGQIGDTGFLDFDGEKVKVLDTKKENDLIIHFIEKFPQNIRANDVLARVDTEKRKLTANNHSATHLLHAALRQVLGKHVQQKGSLVNPDYLRFDFSHFQKVTEDELQKIEQIVNEKIRENISQQTEIMPIKKAMDTGAMALFGEKYGEQVRVVTFDKNFSIELCGGTHVKSTGQIGYFKITSESAVAAGVRRIEAVTSVKAEEFINEKLNQLHEISNELKNPKNILNGIKNLLEENSRMKKEMESLYNLQAIVIKEQLKNKIQKINGVNFIGEIVKLNSAEVIKNLCFNLKNEVENLFLIVGADIDGKANLSLLISDNLVKENKLDAGKIIREVAKEIQGGGGGQPFFATAGGINVNGLQIAIEKTKTFLTQ